MRPLIAVLLFASACTFDPRGSALDDDSVDPDPTDPAPDATVPPEVDAAPIITTRCTVEGDLIGVDGLVVEIRDRTVVIERWMPSQENPGEYLGFELSEDARFEVRAGERTYLADGTSWMHPDAEDGDAPRIARVEFCDLGDGWGGGPGGDD